MKMFYFYLIFQLVAGVLTAYYSINDLMIAEKWFITMILSFGALTFQYFGVVKNHESL